MGNVVTELGDGHQALHGGDAGGGAVIYNLADFGCNLWEDLFAAVLVAVFLVNVGSEGQFVFDIVKKLFFIEDRTIAEVEIA